MTKQQALLQLTRAIENGWIKLFADAAEKHGWPMTLLLGIASRESGMRNIIGDNGHAYGLMQVDDRTDPDILDCWQNAKDAIAKGTEILSEKREWIVSNAGKTRTLRDSKKNKKRFVVPSVVEPLLTTLSVAAYNCGYWTLYHYACGRNPDFSTTGKNYSADVLARVKLFDFWLLRLTGLSQQLISR